MRNLLTLAALFSAAYYFKTVFFDAQPSHKQSHDKSVWNKSKLTLNDAYILFNLQKPTSIGKVKKRYQTLCRQYHPDFNNDHNDSLKKMQQINAAYTLFKKHFKA